MLRVMLSSHRLWPRSCSARVVFMVSPRPYWRNDIGANGPMWVLGPDRQPLAPCAREQSVGGVGAGAAGDVIGKIVGGIARPRTEQPLDRAPSRLNRIGPLEQRGITDQTIVDQRLVAHCRERLEIVAVSKVHRHAVDLDLCAGPLYVEADRKSFVWLDAERHNIGR